MRHKLHADAAAHAAWDELMLSTIGLDSAAKRAAAKTTGYAASRSFVSGDQGTLGSSVLDRHAGLLTPERQERLTGGTPSLVTLATDEGADLVDNAGNLLAGWI